MVIISKRAFLTVISTVGLSFVASECPNSCSGHGQCGSHDMCSCDRNWQGADCSLRTCPFGRAHVDIPKGDLDFSQSITGITTELISGSTIYPYGTTEGYPLIEDTAGTALDHTAHEYAECSNKGKCDRSVGVCDCMEGYDGSACQRASCPTDIDPKTSMIHVSVANDGRTVSRSQTIKTKTLSNVQNGQCSGRGTCESISKLANLDGGNEYTLWDKDSTMGCSCDPGWTGPSCNERLCKYGIDPLYTDDTTAKVTQSTVHIESSDASSLSGKYALKFYDVYGDDHITKPLDIDPTGVFSGVNVCDAATDALKQLPNGVVPSVLCSWTTLNTNKGFEYTLTFTGNPGHLKQLEIVEKLDGSQSTIQVSSGTYEALVFTKESGEFSDYFAERCEGITVKILADSADSDNTWSSHVRPGSLGYLTSPTGTLSALEKKKLKACLGDSDYDENNNVDVSNWDKGFVEEANDDGNFYAIGAFPHAVKLVPVESTANYDKFMNGQYYLVWFDPNAESDNKEFRVANLNNNANVLSESETYYLYSTKGTVQQMGYGNESPLQIADNSNAGVSSSSTRIVGMFSRGDNKIYTNYDTSCVNNPTSGNRNHVCVKKGDKLFVVDSCWALGDLDSSGNPIGNPVFGGSLVADCATSADVNYNTGNLYTVTRVYTVPKSDTSSDSPADTYDVDGDPSAKKYVNTFIIEVAENLPWTGPQGDPENSNTSPAGSRDTTWSDNTGAVFLFHFNPVPEIGTFTYTSMCSNRGRCDRDVGLCQCFKGYTSDDCSVQNSLAAGI